MSQLRIEAHVLLAAIGRRNPVGCCLHVTLDDGNLETRDFQCAAADAFERDHGDCYAIAVWAQGQSMEVREQLRAAWLAVSSS